MERDSHHQSHDHMGNRAVEKVVKTEVRWPVGSGLTSLRASHRLPTTVPPPHPREGDTEAGSALKLTSWGALPDITRAPLDFSNRPPPSLPAQKPKLSCKWEGPAHCLATSAGGTESLTSLISLSPAQLAYPATQNDLLCPGQQTQQYSKTL